jgi:hypothetical protein
MAAGDRHRALTSRGTLCRQRFPATDHLPVQRLEPLRAATALDAPAEGHRTAGESDPWSIASGFRRWSEQVVVRRHAQRGARERKPLPGGRLFNVLAVDVATIERGERRVRQWLGASDSDNAWARRAVASVQQSLFAAVYVGSANGLTTATPS